jgi:hypothetical protein
MEDPRQNWTLNTAIAADWPFTGLVQMGNLGTTTCLEAPAAYLSTGYRAGAPMGLGTCLPFMNSHLEFTAFGTIKLHGYCLTADAGSGNVLYRTCDGTQSQQWTRAGNQILSSQQLCIGVADDAQALGTLAKLQPCSISLYQAWNLEGLAESWPPAAGVPSTVVVDASLTARQVNAVVDWIQAETAISSTPFCYRTESYDRGIGIAPGCSSTQQLDAGLCYQNCRSGFKGVGPVCWSTQSLSYNPGQECTKKLGGLCVMTKMKSCRDGYTSDHVATCWNNTPNYGRDAGSLPTDCGSGRTFQSGLCYVSARTGYSCSATVCNQNCATGSIKCGDSACARNANTCANNIIDMVMGPMEVLGFIATGGAAGLAVETVKTAETAAKIAKTASAIYQAEEALRDATGNFMDVAENNLADMSTARVEAALATGYGKGSANYRFIAREWAARLLLLTILELEKDIITIMVTTMDPTGIAATANAFAKPPCALHTAMPKF